MSRILIADDDPLLCELISFKLEAAGYDVQVATDGQAALEAARLDPPDIIVLDCMMPIMAGQQVLRELMNSPQTKSVPVIMLSARKGQADIIEALHAGAADYLTKPFFPEELVARVQMTLSRSTGSAVRANAA